MFHRATFAGSLAMAGVNVSHGRKLAVVGLGYVGLPVAAAFARTGASLVGFDVDANRLAQLCRALIQPGNWERRSLPIRICASPRQPRIWLRVGDQEHRFETIRQSDRGAGRADACANGPADAPSLITA
jgi:6-phosphogluconate dehydrogenase (decarboxylating)